MVIQRNKPIVFRGKANAGETVKVNFNGHMLSAINNDAGKWKITFPAEKAGGPYKAQISTKKEKLTIKDIYVGEVWLCSGQSNMELPIKWLYRVGHKT